MSRVAKSPINIPAGVEVTVAGDKISVKGAKGQMEMARHRDINVNVNDNVATIEALSSSKQVHAMSGTTRALLSNLVTGVTTGFEKKLQMVGVGYRGQVQGNVLNLTLGFSHPVNYAIPEGISIESPSPTELIVKGIDKQKVGQVAADIRAYRPPEPYKGKGVRYADEVVVIKEAKKK